MTIPHLHRTTSETSRALEFFTERELTMQLGFAGAVGHRAAQGTH